MAAYTGMWTAMARAGETSSYRSPELARYAADTALKLLVSGLYSNQQSGVVTKGRPVLSPKVVRLIPPGSPTQADILDCGDDTHWLKYKTNGQLQNDRPGGRRKITAVVKNLSGIWKVTAFQVGDVGTC